MMTHGIVSLWRGEVPLATVFWEYAVAWGTLINLLFTGAALVSLVNRAPDWLSLSLHFAPTPLNALFVLATWRAAAREPDSPLAGFARIGVVVWFLLMLAL